MSTAIDAAKARLAAAAGSQNTAADTAKNEAFAKDAAIEGGPTVGAVIDGAGAAGQNNLNTIAQGGVAPVTPAAAGDMGVHLGQLGASTAGTAGTAGNRAVAKEEAKERAVAALKTAHNYIHIFAGAGTNMPNGKRINFNGRPGGQGYYSTTKQDEIDFLEELADSAGSQVSRDERELLIDNPLREEQRQAYADSTVNSARQLDAGVVAAQDNLGRTIAATSGL